MVMFLFNSWALNVGDGLHDITHISNLDDSGHVHFPLWIIEVCSLLCVLFHVLPII